MYEIYHTAKRIIELRQQAALLENERKVLEQSIREYLNANSAHTAHIHDVHMMIERETSRRVSLTSAKKVLSPEMIDSLCTASTYERVKVW